VGERRCCSTTTEHLIFEGVAEAPEAELTTSSHSCDDFQTWLQSRAPAGARHISAHLNTSHPDNRFYVELKQELIEGALVHALFETGLEIGVGDVRLG
jgi:hypothetical protein